MGNGISGAGPSIFALCKGKAIAKNVADVIRKSYIETGISLDVYVSEINTNGVEIITNI